ncbi:CoA transferase [Rhizobium sp. AN80A]|uniref:CaiB/BaiF CoA transferase family protein n=1 Tax=Rhizobium sp. AN80A TaxID=3040673 RepID=UPI0024B32A33|nr:CoA transferase [Rhizobium sp. AN80A]
MIEKLLEGIRVVDFSWVLAGPMTTKMLGAMGAEVIKVESGLRPEYRKRQGWPAVVNNNKKSSTINFTTPEGKEIVRELIRKSDILVENFSARVLKGHGLDYESVKRINERMIYVSASGVGRSGPQKDYLAYGTLLQSYSGRVGMIGEPNPRGESMGILPAWTDPVTAMWEVLAIVTALRHRKVTGMGSYIDLSMLESTVALLPESVIRLQLGLETREQGGNRTADCAPAGCFKCAGADAWVALSVAGDAEWKALCGLMRRPELFQDERYATREARISKRDDLNAMVAGWLADEDADVVERLLVSNGLSAARSRSIADVIDEHTKAGSGLFPDVEHLKTIALPWKDIGGKRGRTSAAPALGDANQYVFGDLLGIPPEEIDRLVTEGVIV